MKAAIEWLHKNDISGVATDGNPLDKLANIMPQIDPEMVQQRLYGKRSKRSSYYKKNPAARKRRLSNRLNTTKQETCCLRTAENKCNRKPTVQRW